MNHPLEYCVKIIFIETTGEKKLNGKYVPSAAKGLIQIGRPILPYVFMWVMEISRASIGRD